MFSCTEGLIIVALATTFILPSAEGESCGDRSSCPECPQPLSSPAFCASRDSMFVASSRICTCCDQCVPYLSLLEWCRKYNVVYFPKIGGGTSAVTEICKPPAYCDKYRKICLVSSNKNK